MAVLSIQLVFSMITASFLSKFAMKLSAAKRILTTGLVRYVHPSDEELRQLAGVPPTSKGHKHKREPQKNESFTIPKSTHIQLDTAPIRQFDVLPLSYYTEYQWLVDFAACGLFIYLATELYYMLMQPEEFNLSMLWCLLVIGFCLKVMFSLTAMYFRVVEGGEKILCVVFGFFFLVLSMAILIVNEDTLEFGLTPAYYNFSQEALVFLRNQGIESHGPASLLTFRIVLAIVSAIIGSFVTFPGLRLAKMHSDALKYASERPFLQVLFHMNIIFPFLISLMWVKPVIRDMLVRDYGASILMSDETFEVIRIMMVIGFCVFRLFMVRFHLQAHLNMAVDKVEQLRKEAGRISAIEVQKMVTRVFYYLCVVALQYLAPLIVLFFLALMLKTMGNYSITDTLGLHVQPLRNLTAAAAAAEAVTPDGSIRTTAAQVSLALTSLKAVFSQTVFRGLISYFLWWLSTAWFTTSAFGLVYYAYFLD